MAELRERMDNREFIYWQVYYGRKAQRRQLATKAQQRKAAGRRRR